MKKLPRNEHPSQTDNPTSPKGKVIELKNTRGLLSIGKAAKLLGVSVDTVRNWEKSGKLMPVRTAGGVRKYRLSEINKIKGKSAQPEATSEIEVQAPKADDSISSLTSSLDKVLFRGNISAIAEAIPAEEIQIDQDPEADVTFNHEYTQKQIIEANLRSASNPIRKLTNATLTLALGALFATLTITTGYLTAPTKTTAILASINNSTIGAAVQPVTEPLNNLSGQLLAKISPLTAADLGFTSYFDTVSPEALALDTHLVGVLATETASGSAFLEINSNAKFGGPITAPNLITSFIAGDNVSITPGTVPTISAILPETVVTSLNGSAEEMTLAAGTDLDLTASNNILTLINTSDLSTSRGRGGCSSCVTDADTTDDLVIDATGSVSGAAIKTGLLGVSFGGTGLTTYTTGDLIYASAGSTLAKLAISSTSSYVLTVSSAGLPAWEPGGCPTCLVQVPTSNTAGATNSNIVYPSATGVSALIIQTNTNSSGSPDSFKLGSAFKVGYDGNTTSNNTLYFANGTTYKIDSSGNANFLPLQNIPIGTTTAAAANFTTIGVTSTGTAAFTSLTSSGNTALATGAGSNVTLGNAGAFSLTSTGLNVSTAGALTGVAGITNSGAYTQTGTSANTFTGTATFSNATYSALFSNGNVGAGDTTPTGFFTVGNGDLFTIDATGAITAATGITSSGTITFSGVTNAGAAGVTHSSSTGVLSSSAINLAGGANEVSNALPIANGGTGTTTTPTSGQLLIGTTAGGYSVATLSDGSNIVTTNGSGSISVATSLTPTFTTVNGLTQTANADGFAISGGTTSRSITVTGSDITLTGGGNTLTLTGSGTLNQDLRTSASPSFSSLTLTATSNQLVLGTTRTVTISGTTPSLSRVYTIPDFGGADSFVALAATQTLTNKSISGSTNTFSAASIANASLTNSSFTLTAGTGLSGGGTATLGGAAVTFNNTGVLSVTGTSNQVNASASTGAITLSLPQSIGTVSSPQFAGLTLTSGLTMSGVTTDFTTGSSEDLIISPNGTGKVGIATSSPTSLFSVGSSNQFQIDSSGNMVKINNVTYNWPSSVTDTYMLQNDGSGNLTWTQNGPDNKWSSLDDPNGNLAISLAGYTTTFTSGATTGASNLWSWTDTTNNTGTGYLVNLTAANSSNIKPFHVGTSSVDSITVASTGAVGIGDSTPTGLFTVGTSDAFQVNSSGGITFNPASTTSIANITNSVTSISAGAVGTWTSVSTTIPAVRYQHGVVTHNGYIFVIGGYDGGSGTSTVYSAQVKSDGTTGSWSTLNTLPAIFRIGATMVSNGYLFVAAGNNDVSRVSTVYSAKINDNGTIGNWNTLNTLPQLLQYVSGAGYNGYIFVTGGSGGAAIQSTVYSAVVNGNGTIGTWQTLNTLPILLNSHSTVTANGYLFVIGGHDGTSYRSVVYSAAIKADGTIGTWATLNTLPALNANFSAFSHKNYLYVVGGTADTVTGVSTVYSAAINSNGTIGSWSALNTLPILPFYHTAVAVNGYVYIPGGYSAATGALSAVYSTPLANTNLVSNSSTAFATGNLLDLWNNSQSKLSVDYQGNLNTQGYVAFNPLTTGGLANNTPTPQFTSNINSLPAGSTGTYATVANLPVTLSAPTVTSYNNYIYVLGGSTANSNASSVSTVYSAKVNADGTISGWTSLNTLPSVVMFSNAVASSGYLFLLGGVNAAGTELSTVYSARINSDGTIGSWNTLNTMPALKDSMAVVAYNSYLYIFGGWNGAAATSVVYSAQINGNGTIGSWATLSTLPVILSSPVVVQSNDYAYFFGGFTTTIVSTVYSVQLKSDGTIGTWQTLNAMPKLSLEFGGGAWNGYVYLVGGSTANSNATATSTVYSAQLKVDGTIGSWAILNTLPATSWRSRAITSGGYLFALAGVNSSGTVLSTVYSTPLQSDSFAFNASALGNTSLTNGNVLDFWNNNSSVAGVTYTGALSSNVGVAINQTSTTPTANFTQSLNGLTAGSTGTYVTLNPLPAVFLRHSATTYNGYIFVSGGVTTGGTGISTVYSTKVNSDGTINGWQSLTSTPVALYDHTLSAANGYLFVTGGTDGSLSTVYSAKILESGTIGSWNTLNTLPAINGRGASVISNNYLFSIGGFNGTLAMSTVYSAAINGNGTIGTWQTLTVLPQLLQLVSAATYNNYIFVTGGADTASTAKSTVYSAPVRPDGTIGSWATLNTLPAVVRSHGTVAANGYLYTLGGYNGSVGISAVYSAKINVDGTVGSWSASNTMPTINAGLTTVATNGYIFALNGSSTGLSATAYSTAYSTPLQSNAFAFGTTSNFTAGNLLDIWNNNSSKVSLDYAGNLIANGVTLTGTDGMQAGAALKSGVNSIQAGSTGTWATLATLPAVLQSAGSTSYNGYIYTLGGYNGSAAVSTVYSAKANSDGTIGAWSSLNTIPALTRLLGTTAHNGYLFAAGGLAGAALSTVYSAKILDNGTIGTWNTLNTLPAITYSLSLTSYNGYLFAAGGHNGTLRLSTVYSAQINGNGTIGAWATLNTMPQILSDFVMVANNGYLFVAGGNNTTSAVSTVYSVPIKSDGTIGTWATLNTMPAVEYQIAGAVGNGYLYILGGTSNGTTMFSTVYSVQLKADGTVGSWATLNTLPAVVSQQGNVVINGYLFNIGGQNGSAAVSTVYSVPIQSDAFATNTTSNITAGNLIDVINNGQSLAGVDYSGRLSSALGVTINNTSTTPTANITTSLTGLTPGSTGTYATLSGIPVILRGQSTVIYNGYMFVTGGINSVGTVVSTVYSAKVSVDGTIGNWATLATMPAVTYLHSTVAANGYLYMFGGNTGSPISTVYSAAINNNGTLGSWNTLNTLPSLLHHFGATVSNDYVFVVGGCSLGNCTTVVSTVYSAQLKSDGTIGTWQTLNTLPQPLHAHPAVASNGYIFALGGHNGGGLSTVYSAAVKADGTIGTWATLNTLPQTLYQFSATVFNGYIYVTGGNTGVSTVYSARTNMDGTIGSWAALNTLPTLIRSHSTLSANGYMYIIGGYNGSTNLSTVYSVPLQSDAFAFNTTNTYTSGNLLDVWNQNTSKFSVDYSGTVSGTSLTLSNNVSLASVDSTNINVGIKPNLISTAPAIGPGGTGSYTTLNNLPVTLYNTKGASYNNYFYVTGGHNGTTAVSTVYTAKVNADGTLASWQTLNTLPQIIYGHVLIASNGYLFVAGGNNAVTDLSTVYSAKINADGTVGSWNTLNTLPALRLGAAGSAYNNYLYISGGYTAGYTSTVYSAQINGNGTIGTWATLNTLPQILQNHSMVSHNGYLWVVGGYNGTLRTSTVYSAAIKADGTIGTWATLNTLPQINNQHFGGVFNGYLYIVGGDSGSYLSTVYTTQLKADGTVGTWAAVNNIPAIMGYMAGAISGNGYLLIAGGINAAVLSTVYSTPLETDALAFSGVGTSGNLLDLWNNTTSVAGVDSTGRFQTNSGVQINQTSTTPTANLVSSVQGLSQGNVGSYQTLANLPQLLYYHGMTSYNGYIYTIGGYNGASLSVVYSAKINTDGTTGPWTSLNTLPAANHGAGAVAYNGYLLVVGGTSNAGVAYSTVYSSKINADGTIGSWSTLNTMPTVRSRASVTVYDNYLYVTGGSSDNGVTLTSTVYSVQINGNGTIGTWQTLNTLPAVVYLHKSLAYNGYLFSTGGYNGSTTVSTVYSAPILGNGIIGTWATLNTLPALTYGHGLNASGGYLYVTGGNNNSTYVSTVYAAQVKADGTIGSWATLNTLPAIGYLHGSTVSNGYLITAGGLNSAALSTVYSTPLTSTAFAFNTVNTFTNGNLVDLWNNNASKFNVDYAANVSTQGTFTVAPTCHPGLDPGSSKCIPTINSNVLGIGSGSIGSWATLNTLPAINEYHRMASHNGYIYSAGGFNGSAYFSTLYSAKVNADGTIGSWATLNTLPALAALAGFTTYNGYLYLAGGFSGATPVSTMYSAKILADGTIGSWSTLNTLPAVTRSQGLTAYSGYLYMVGGYNGTVALSTVYSAQINGNGTIGTWATLNTLAALSEGSGVVASNGYLFVTGGYTGSVYLSTVYSAPIKSDGTIGTWATLNTLPALSASQITVASNGYLFVAGGTNAGGHLSTAYSAQIKSDGTIGSWATMNTLPALSGNAASTISNDYLFFTGGYNGTSYFSTVYSAPLRSSSFTLGANPSTSSGSNIALTAGNLLDVWNAGSAVFQVDYQGKINTNSGVQINNNSTTPTANMVQSLNGLGAGSTGTYATLNPLPVVNKNAAVVSHNGYIYAIGGNTGSVVSTSYFAKVNADGTIGGWSTTTALPAVRYLHASAVYNGYIFILGGNNGVAVSTVYSTKINADGTLSSWNTLNTLPAINTQLTAVATNGYLFALGGNNDTLDLSTVYSAQILGNGIIGTWQTLNTLPQLLEYSTAVAANGYIFMIGGGNSAAVSTVYSAAVKADGTIGTWQTLNTLPIILSIHVSVAYNNYLYVFGGSAHSTVYSAQIKSDGTIGGWATLNTLPTLIGYSGGTVANGNFYIVGGYNNVALISTVYSTPLQSNAFTFQSASAFGAGNLIDVWNNNAQIAAIDYSGRLVTNTGLQVNAASTTPTANIVSNVNGLTPGSTGTYQTLANLPQTLRVHSTVTYNGYLFITGGLAGATLSTVYSTKVNSDGTINGWSALNTLPQVLRQHGSTTSNSYLFVLGGYTGAANISTVYSTKINDNGTIGSWNTLNTLPVLLRDHSATSYNGYLFVVGGITGSTVSTVYSVAVNGNGTIGTWQTLNTLPALNALSSAVAHNGYLYVTGGDSGSLLSTVYSAAIKTDGTIGTWQTLTAMPAVRRWHSAVVANNYLYIVGGDGGSSISTVYSSQIKTDGTIGNWATLNTLPALNQQLSAVAVNGYIFVTGGSPDASAAVSTVYSTPLQSTALVSNTTNSLTAGNLLDFWNNNSSKVSVDYSGNMVAGAVTLGSTTATGAITSNVQGITAGSTGTYQTLANLPAALHSAASVAYNKNLYLIGGNGNSGVVSTVYYTKINADGTIGGWISTTNLPITLTSHGAVASNGYLFVIAGHNGTLVGSAVYSAKINADGPLGSWNTLNTLPAVRDYMGVATYNGYIFVTGGSTDSGSTATSTVYSAQVNGNGTIGAWQTLTVLPGNNDLHSTVAHNGYLYVFGGYRQVDGYLSTTYSAPIKSDGTIGSWTALTTLPAAIGWPTVGVSNGYVYFFGGYNGNTTLYLSTVFSAQIKADGTIGTWATLNTLPQIISKVHSSTPTSDGYAFLVGGFNGTSRISTTYSVPLQSNTFVTKSNETQTNGNLLDLWNNLSSKFSVDFAGSVNTASGLTINPASNTPSAQFASSIDGVAAGSTGTYQTLTNLPAVSFGITTVSYNGYLFATGGYNGSSYLSTAYSAKINKDGTLGPWVSLTNLPATARVHMSAAYQGYLFVAGGENAGAYLSTIYSSKISSDGTIGSWSTLNTLPSLNRNGAMIASNGYLYVVGGNDGTLALSTFYSAPILADGKVGTWATLSTLPVLSQGSSLAVLNSFMYIVGSTGTGTAVYSVSLKADGTVSTYQTLTVLPAARAYASAGISNGYLYVIGGTSDAASTGSVSTVYSAKIASGGTVGSWATLNTLPQKLFLHGSSMSDGHLFVVGGQNSAGAAVSTVYSTPIQSTAFAFNTKDNLTNGNLIDVWNQGVSKFSVDYAGNLAIAGKFQSNIVPTQDGIIGSWATLNTLPAVVYTQTVVVNNGYVFSLGGYSGVAYISTVYSAPIKTDGTIGNWSTLNTLPALRGIHAAAVYNNYLFVAGGNDGVNHISTVYSAQIKADGTIGTWATLNTMPATRSRLSLTTYGGYLFQAGGEDGGGKYSTLYSVAINADGTIGTWATLNTLPAIVSEAATVAYNGYLFITGGNDGAGLSTAYSAPIKSDGTIGTWQTLTVLPAVRRTHSATVYNGYLYISGGLDGAGADTSTVYSAAIKADGTIGSWATLNTMPAVVSHAKTAIYNGYLFSLGGYSGAATSTVYSASLTTSRAFVFNTVNTYPEGTSLGGSASLFTLQDNGDARFDVDAQGNGRFLGMVNAAGAILGTPGQVGDLAENMPVEDETIEAGDLVAAHPGHDGLIKTQNPYDQRVIGIISTKASITFSPETEKGRPVALAGRVPVKVSMQNGLIKAGDWLTSSSTPGIAMKASKPGPMIGQALENQVLNNDKVLAFVSLSYADPNSLLSKLSLDEEGRVVASSVKTSNLRLGSIEASGSALALNESNVGSSPTPSPESVDLRAKLVALDTGYTTQAIDIEQLKSQVLGLQSDQIASATAQIDSLDARLADPANLFASESATLAGLNISDRVSVASLSTIDATISGIFKSLGDSFLTRSFFSSDVTVDGTFSITNGNALNAIGTLFIQNTPLAKLVDFVNGKVTISDTGLFKSEGKITAPEVNTKRLILTGPSIGSAKITAGSNSVTISTGAVDAGAKIFITAVGSADQTLSATNIQPGASFDVVVNSPVSSDLEFNWVLIKSK